MSRTTRVALAVVGAAMIISSAQTAYADEHCWVQHIGKNYCLEYVRTTMKSCMQECNRRCSDWKDEGRFERPPRSCICFAGRLTDEKRKAMCQPW